MVAQEAICPGTVRMVLDPLQRSGPENLILPDAQRRRQGGHAIPEACTVDPIILAGGMVALSVCVRAAR